MVFGAWAFIFQCLHRIKVCIYFFARLRPCQRDECVSMSTYISVQTKKRPSSSLHFYSFYPKILYSKGFNYQTIYKLTYRFSIPLQSYAWSLPLVFLGKSNLFFCPSFVQLPVFSFFFFPLQFYFTRVIGSRLITLVFSIDVSLFRFFHNASIGQQNWCHWRDCHGRLIWFWSCESSVQLSISLHQVRTKCNLGAQELISFFSLGFYTCASLAIPFHNVENLQ